MKNFKSIMSIVLSFTLIFGIPSINLANNFAEDINPSFYDVHKLVFPEPDQIIKSNNLSMMDKTEVDSVLMKQKEKNIMIAKKEVNSLNLEQKGYYGLKEAFLAELDMLLKSDVYLENYSIYIPNSEHILMRESDPINYGTYEGFKFMASFSVYNQSYRKSTTDWRKIDSWLSGAVAFGMNFMVDWITIPLSVLEIVADEITVYDGSWIDVTTSEEVTNRLILIQDLNMKYTPSPNNYVGVLNDQSKIVSLYTVLYPNSPYFPPSLTGTEGPKEVPSKYFYNRTRTMSNALNYYIQSDGSGMYQDLVPRGTLGWD